MFRQPPREIIRYTLEFIQELDELKKFLLVNKESKKWAEDIFQKRFTELEAYVLQDEQLAKSHKIFFKANLKNYYFACKDLILFIKDQVWCLNFIENEKNNNTNMNIPLTKIDAENLLKLARAYYHTANFNKAIISCQIITTSPKISKDLRCDAWIGIIKSYFHLGDLQQALDCTDLIIDNCKPEEKLLKRKLLMIRAEIQKGLNNVNDAVADYNSILNDHFSSHKIDLASQDETFIELEKDLDKIRKKGSPMKVGLFARQHKHIPREMEARLALHEFKSI